MNDRQPPVLLFPTHYLGNFILGLPWVSSVLKKHPDAVVVLDAQFEELARLLLNDEARLLLYPRQQISKGQAFFIRLFSYWRFISSLRNIPADTILDLEGERFTGVLARLSGIANRVGPTGKRAETFYSDIRDLNYQNHRFNAFGEIVEGFTDGGVPASNFTYAVEGVQASIDRLLYRHDSTRALVAIHPGASVAYKLWPRSHFVELVNQLHESGCQVVWVGAGQMDSEIINDVQAQVGNIGTINLCNRLSFVQLAALYTRCKFFIGSDSGPMHLAASTGIPVFALFGPSDESIWAPLGSNSHMVRSAEPCGENCNAFRCDLDYQCMKTLQADAVIAAVKEKLPELNSLTTPREVQNIPRTMFESLPVSAYIITLNEAHNIGACLDRLVEFDEVVLVDSGSTDGTIEIASQYENVKVSYNEWPGFSAQKAHALSLCENEWVLNVDADEILSDEYIDEARRVVTEDQVDGLESNRRLYRWGKAPKYFDGDDRLIRLFRKSAGHYEPRRVHECITVEGKIAKTDAIIEHYENLTYSQRVDKANKYSQARAEDKFEEGGRAPLITLIFIFPITFLQMYFFKGNFRDGVDGLLSSMNAAFYAFMKYAKLWELRKGRRKK